LWTLAEYNMLEPAQLRNLLLHDDPVVRQSVLSLLPSIITKQNYDNQLFHEAHELMKKDSSAAPVVVFLAEKIAQFDKKWANTILADAARLYPNNRFVADAVLCNLHDRE